jgi:hypothetical protein
MNSLTSRLVLFSPLSLLVHGPVGWSVSQWLLSSLLSYHLHYFPSYFAADQSFAPSLGPTPATLPSFDYSSDKTDVTWTHSLSPHSDTPTHFLLNSAPSSLLPGTLSLLHQSFDASIIEGCNNCPDIGNPLSHQIFIL